jgi:hypothetical protein
MAIIAAIPSTIDWLSSTEELSQITVLSIRGGVYDNTDITNNCIFNRIGDSGSGITVGTFTGSIYTSASSTTITETVIIACYAYEQLVDYVHINISNYSFIFDDITNSMYIPQL